MTLCLSLPKGRLCQCSSGSLTDGWGGNMCSATSVIGKGAGLQTRIDRELVKNYLIGLNEFKSFRLDELHSRVLKFLLMYCQELCQLCLRNPGRWSASFFFLYFFAYFPVYLDTSQKLMCRFSSLKSCWAIFMASQGTIGRFG